MAFFTREKLFLKSKEDKEFLIFLENGKNGMLCFHTVVRPMVFALNMEGEMGNMITPITAIEATQILKDNMAAAENMLRDMSNALQIDNFTWTYLHQLCKLMYNTNSVLATIVDDLSQTARATCGDTVPETFISNRSKNITQD